MLDEFLFVDDMTEGSPTKKKLQIGVDQVSNSCDSCDLTISIKQVVYHPVPEKSHKEPTITVKGSTLEANCLELCTLMMKSMPGLLK